ncbi:MarR family transcriptional regulator [Streptomyces sp. NBC_01525]|uniref:MarR family transcriptional regulator n=1 Tax=Streptomyces benahoarensis TaxID=2595054 RepID=A0A553ZLC1_9ACTN|nr:MarR family transcriptional regulator [Streptomyces benahoarensis]TSB22376.1 MarR family transcriptional regulator [Streptomyces benahoarensis]TSB42193.1 MarR family transcriptional regulator [Streptomyces benahoarensis]
MKMSGRLAQLDVWLLSNAAHQAKRLLCAHLDRTGLRMQHYRVMAGLTELGECTQAELGRALELDAGNLVALLGDLEEARAVTREPDPANRRRNLVRCTPQGRRLYRRMDEAVARADEAMFASFSEEERDQFHQLLARLVAAAD